MKTMKTMKADGWVAMYAYEATQGGANGFNWHCTSVHWNEEEAIADALTMASKHVRIVRMPGLDRFDVSHLESYAVVEGEIQSYEQAES